MQGRTAAALGALLLVLGACGNGAPEEAVRGSFAEVPPTGASTTTSVVAPTTTPSTVRRTTTSFRAATTTTTTMAPVAAVPQALTPAAPGTYRYDTSGTTTLAGSTTPFPAVTTLVVSPPSGTTQRLTRDLRDPAGTGLATEFVLDYRPQGIYVVSLGLTVGFSGITQARELRPASPVLLLATGARPGARTDVDLGGTTPARLLVEVVGEERVTVAGRAVDTLVLRATVTLAPGEVTGRQQLTLNLDRGSRLWVRERSVTEASAAGGLFTLRSQYTATLQRLANS